METATMMPPPPTATVHSAGTSAPPPTPWPLWQRILFRFFFAYFVLQITPWDFFSGVPGLRYVFGLWDGAINWAVTAANANIFHTYEKLILPNGSGDTSWMWTAMKLYLIVSLIACMVWSVLDYKRPEYTRLNYWLRQFVRYYVAAAALSYGIIKLYALQMVFPSTSQLATPLGDLLPMRFSWLFIGYSLPYQIFSGVMETMAGLLLLYRRTITAGLFAASGAFANVVMINLSYDVPVKHYSMHLLFCCLFLLAQDSERLLKFLVLNKPTPPTEAYTPTYSKPWHMWGARAAKAWLVYALLILPLYNNYGRYKAVNAPPVQGPIKTGVYDVKSYVVNKTAMPMNPADTIRWKDLIIDSNGAGSIATGDQVFQRRYGRGYFRFKADTAKQMAAVWKTSTIPRDSTFLFTMRYEVPDTNTVRLHTVIRGDSVHVELVRVARHFQLAERQFHWLSEYNR